MMKATITEIFSSIQGEGLYVGTKQVFVRFGGCQAFCCWCDTPAQYQKAKKYTIEDVFKKIFVLRSGCHSVSLTGGEPLLQSDFIKELLPYIKKMRLKTYLETNGILYQELQKIIKNIDIVSMDFKLPSSTKSKAYWKEHKEFLKIARAKEVFVKVVISKDTQVKDVRNAIILIRAMDKRIPFILQPNYKENVLALKKCLEYHQMCQKTLTNVRIIPQVHKILKIR